MTRTSLSPADRVIRDTFVVAQQCNLVGATRWKVKKTEKTQVSSDVFEAWKVRMPRARMEEAPTYGEVIGELRSNPADLARVLRPAAKTAELTELTKKFTQGLSDAHLLLAPQVLPSARGTQKPPSHAVPVTQDRQPASTPALTTTVKPSVPADGSATVSDPYEGPVTEQAFMGEIRELLTNPAANKGALINALHQAAEYGFSDAIRLMCGAGVDPNATGFVDSTAVMYAAYAGHPSCIQALHDCGADVSKTSRSGWTAVMSASQRGRVSCLELLHSLGVGVNKADSDGFTAAMYAAGHGHGEFLRALARCNADFDKVSRNGSTATSCAAFKNQADCVRILRDLGANVNFRNKKGESAADVAEKRGYTDVMAVFWEPNPPK